MAHVGVAAYGLRIIYLIYDLGIILTRYDLKVILIDRRTVMKHLVRTSDSRHVLYEDATTLYFRDENRIPTGAVSP